MPSVALIGTRGYPSYYGGFETAVRILAPYLAEQGWDVSVYGREGAIKHDDPTRDPRVKTVTTGGLESKSLSTLTHGLTATWDASRKKPDVALVMNVANGFFFPILKVRGIPTVVNVDGIEWERDKWGKAAKALFKAGAKMTARFGDRLVFDADAIGDYWRSNFERDGAMIPYGGEFYQEELPIEPNLKHRGYVIAVARFVPENTINEFFDAVEDFGREIPTVIVGSSGYGGEFDERAADLASRLPHVQWLGHVSDDLRLHSLWQHAGLYFHGHSVGGTNPALVQAMALGAPTLARDTVYNREVLSDTGEFVAPHAAEISARVRQLMGESETLESLSERTHARASNVYTWTNVCEAYQAELLKAIEEAR